MSKETPGKGGHTGRGGKKKLPLPRGITGGTSKKKGKVLEKAGGLTDKPGHKLTGREGTGKGIVSGRGR